MGIAQDLHLDMAGTAHQFFQINFVLAERGLGLAPRGEHRIDAASASLSIGRIPRPPPPQDAFSITG